MKRPDRINIDKSDLKHYKALSEEVKSVKQLKENKNLFLFALSRGVSAGTRIPIKSKEGYVRSEYFHGEDDALLQAVAIKSEGNLEVTSDWPTIYSIAEEYARAGIGIFADEISDGNFGSFMKKYEARVLKNVRKEKNTSKSK
jgi:hypothetical protein